MQDAWKIAYDQADCQWRWKIGQLQSRLQHERETSQLLQDHKVLSQQYRSLAERIDEYKAEPSNEVKTLTPYSHSDPVKSTRGRCTTLAVFLLLLPLSLSFSFALLSDKSLLLSGNT